MPSGRSSSWPSRCPRSSWNRIAGRRPSSTWPGHSVIRNSAHDSICACSADDVVDAVLHRYAEARHIGEGLTEQALQAVGRSMALAGPVVVNPSATDRSGMVELIVPAVGDAGPDVQVLSERTGLPGSITLDGETVRNMLGMLQGARIDDQAYVTDVSLAEDETGLDVTVVIGPEPRDGVPVEEVKRELYTRLTDPTRYRGATLHRPARRAPAAGPPGARARVRLVPLHPGRSWPTRWRRRGAVRVLTWATGWSRSPSTRTTGTFAVDGVPGFGRLVDGGDHGDTYNYSPPAHDSVVDTPHSVVVTVGDRGPVRATVDIATTYDWPECVDGTTRTRTGRRPVAVTTTLELRADEPMVRVRTRFDQPVPGPPSAGAPPTPRPGGHLRGRVRLHRGRAGADRRRPATRSSACPRSPRAGSYGPAGSPWSTRACSSTSWSTSPTAPDGSGRPPRPWRSPSCGPPGCCPGSGCRCARCPPGR